MLTAVGTGKRCEKKQENSLQWRVSAMVLETWNSVKEKLLSHRIAKESMSWLGHEEEYMSNILGRQSKMCSR